MLRELVQTWIIICGAEMDKNPEETLQGHKNRFLHELASIKLAAIRLELAWQLTQNLIIDS